MISLQSASLPSAELNTLPFWSIDEESTSALPGWQGIPNFQQKWSISGWKAYVISERPTDALYYLESITKLQRFL